VEDCEVGKMDREQRLEAGQTDRNSHKSMKDMQEEVDQFIGQFKEGYFSPLAMLARMTEEVGELSREVNHYYGEKPKKSDEEEKTMEQEMGDILFVLICFANSLHIDLEEAFDIVMDKFESRDKDRWTKIDD
jgi:NTP pyrophosphatase (non-canonical NTP hydrolase)